VRKLQEALGDQLCVALDDPSVTEIVLKPDGKLFIERLAPASHRQARCRRLLDGHHLLLHFIYRPITATLF
jgi:type IV secretion system protein TrbB